MTLTISKVVSIQINLDEITDKQADDWMKDVEEKISEALRETGKEMISEAFGGIIHSKAPAGGIKEWCGKWVKTLWGDIRLLFPRPRGGHSPHQHQGYPHWSLRCAPESHSDKARGS